jgi:hypothetical protein
MISDVKGKYDESKIVKVLMRLWVNAYLGLNRDDLGFVFEMELLNMGYFRVCVG